MRCFTLATLAAVAVAACSERPQATADGVKAPPAAAPAERRSDRAVAEAACVTPQAGEDLLRQLDREGGWPAGTLDRSDDCAWALSLSRVAVERYDAATGRAECSADAMVGRYGGPTGWSGGRIRYVVQPVIGGGVIVALAAPLTQEDQLWGAGALAVNAQMGSDCSGGR